MARIGKPLTEVTSIPHIDPSTLPEPTPIPTVVPVKEKEPATVSTPATKAKGFKRLLGILGFTEEEWLKSMKNISAELDAALSRRLTKTKRKRYAVKRSEG